MAGATPAAAWRSYIVNRRNSAMSTTAHPKYDAWYQSTRWRKRRAHQLQSHPFCTICAAQGREGVVAAVADHVTPHRGSWDAFVLGPLQSLCKSCHDHKRHAEIHGYSRDIGIDGLPIDKRHPYYTGRKPDTEPPPPPPMPAPIIG